MALYNAAFSKALLQAVLKMLMIRNKCLHLCEGDCLQRRKTNKQKDCFMKNPTSLDIISALILVLDILEIFLNGGKLYFGGIFLKPTCKKKKAYVYAE